MNKENKLLWIYLTGFFLILALPFLNIPPWFSPPDWGKTIIFKSILAILLFLFIAQTLVKERFAIKTSKVLWSLFGLLGIFGLATIFSMNPSFSFWGNPYRSGGFLNFASYILFAILAFLVLKRSDWSKILNFSLIVGVLVSIVAIFQKFELYGKIFVKAGEPWSTIGGSSFLAVYLLLLSFLALFFITKSIKNLDRKWFFYLPILLLFLFIILITGSRAAYVGLIIGIFYFVFAYPKKIPKIRIVILVFLALVISTVFYVNAEFPIPRFIEENTITGYMIPRLSTDSVTNDPRFSVWKISSRALIEKPLLGYGPENFSIAFDKHYDPLLPRMIPEEHISRIYYDRAHNFIFDISVTAGIPALIIYISLFGFLFYELQKVKKKRPGDALICHTLQASFVAYLTANFFGFDVFSTYIILFLFIGLSSTLITRNIPEKIITIRLKNKIKYPLILLLLVGLVSFIWFCNIKPLQINTEINKAMHSARKSQMERALKTIDALLPSDTFLNEYLRSNYLEIINMYIHKEPNKTIILAPQGIKIVKSALEIKPNYTRYWILLGNYYNILLENYQNVFPENMKGWTEEAKIALEKANELSPKRQEIFTHWARTYMVIGDYETAKEKVQTCIDINPELGICWWTMVEINIATGEIDEAKKNIKMAGERNYPINSEELLLEVLTLYINLENNIDHYKEICEIAYKLYELKDDNVGYNIKALTCYIKENKKEKAELLAEEIKQLWPEEADIIDAVDNLMRQL